MIMTAELIRLRRLCLALPDAHEVEAWGAPTFRVKNKLFAMYAAPDVHHGGGRAGVWIKGTKINQALLIAEDADRYFSPPYVGPGGWVGVRLDRGVDWGEVNELLRDGYRMTAPKKLIAQLDGAPREMKSRPARPAKKKETRRR